MNIDERKALIKNGLEKLAERWLQGQSYDATELWKSGLHGQLSGQARKNVNHVRLLTDKFPQHPLPFVCEESGIPPEKIPTNVEVVFSFTDEKVFIKPLDGTWETLYEK